MEKDKVESRTERKQIVFVLMNVNHPVEITPTDTYRTAMARSGISGELLEMRDVLGALEEIDRPLAAWWVHIKEGARMFPRVKE